MKIKFAAILIVLLLAACGRVVREIQTDVPQVMLETSAGQEIRIILESNPSTGYHWEIVGEFDENVVELVSHEYEADQPVMPGSGGSDVWVFKGVSTGETIISLGYFPPDPKADPQDIRTYAIRVRP